MTLELILQILVFPGLGWIMLQTHRIDVKLSEQARDLTHLEKRLDHLENQLGQNN